MILRSLSLWLLLSSYLAYTQPIYLRILSSLWSFNRDYIECKLLLFLGHFENNGIVIKQKYKALTQMENMVHFCANKTAAVISNSFQNTVTALNIRTKKIFSVYLLEL